MSGRWPANVILSPAMAEALDQQSGTSKSVTSERGKATGMFRLGGFRSVEELREAAKTDAPTPNGRNRARAVLADYEADTGGVRGHNDSGGASRFFLTAGYEPWELEWIIANGLTPCGT